MTKIEWTEKVWNPVTGCTKVSEACKNCYAEVMARRLQRMPGSADKYRNGFNVTIHVGCLGEPLEWKKPSMVFVCSMGDLFHKDVSFDFIDMVMNVIRECPQHTFQILTKRPERMAEYFNDLRGVPKNVWLGTTCESSKHYDRIDHLRRIKSAPVRFISCEPLLDNMPDIDLDRIDWVITGGESGACARPTDPHWFRSLRDAVLATHRVKFFFKQWGAWGEDGVKRSKYKNGSVLDGETWKEYPNSQIL
jgi:protein gp37